MDRRPSHAIVADEAVPPALPPRNRRINHPRRNSPNEVNNPATIGQRIQRNILPDIVCDSFISTFHRQRRVPSPPLPIFYQSVPIDPRTTQPIIREMGQRTSVQPKPNISFAWVLRGDHSTSASSSTTSSLYKKSNTMPTWKTTTDNESTTYTYTTIDRGGNRKKQRPNAKGANKHHLFSEKNLKESDFEDLKFRRALIEGDCLSLSTAETTSINKCVDKATNVKRKRYRNKSRLSTKSDINETDSLVPRRSTVEVKMPRFDEDTSQFDEYLRKCSLLCPANLPMLLVCDTIMYQTRVGYQSETFLPLGTMINGIFSVQDWIYIQLPGKVDQSGYVMASSCIPMGILPRKQRSRLTPDSRFSKSTTDLSSKLMNEEFRPSTLGSKHHGPEFQALYTRVMDRLKAKNLAKNGEIAAEVDAKSVTRKYSLSTQNLQKFNVLSSEAVKQETETLAAKFDSMSLK